MTVRRMFFILSGVSLLVIILLGLVWSAAWWLLVLVVPLISVGIYDISQRRHSLLRNYPVIGHMRYILESIRPEVQQYFVETNTDGRPISLEFRSLVYQRAKGVRDTRPFGTQFDVYRDGYEWITHSISPHQIVEHCPRVLFGEHNCTKPYSASPLNISAMSFGALSQNAIMALNKGAKIDNFAHNTGEGGITPYHLKYGGDLIWQIGTGYFGCRTYEGTFDAALFAKNARKDIVKMIEIKLSQGAKPGHGGILPAAKVTAEIAKIRNVPIGKDVISPPGHSAFSNPIELVTFVKKLRDLSGGKPVGFKLCIGSKVEFLSLCKAMLTTGITPDFITIDGSEGGTGAAPIEMTNSVGTPLREGLVFVHNALTGCGIRDRIRLIAAGKALSAFHIVRLLALGADTVNSARAMMFALGCIQSRSCNNDHCPTGVATQNPSRFQALDVEDKAQRVANYHHAMIINLVELLAAAGMEHLEQVKPHHIQRRISGSKVKHLGEIYHFLEKEALLDGNQLPDDWKTNWDLASEESW
ncbi:MAG: FMN-binding glutamate synthase family protein [Aquificaceae bacterium]|nr:MAG: FMN-binding glutamate synthase family protein [Aquificaceae bacterium]